MFYIPALCCICCYIVCFYCFFFFKQKTAYEMRISDWSSDVCSSDLLREDMGSFADRLGVDTAELVIGGRSFGGRMCSMLAAAGEIGRASCRERVGQYG